MSKSCWVQLAWGCAALFLMRIREKEEKYDVKQECIDEVSSVEAMKEVEKKL